MGQQTFLHIKEPCHENWEAMSPVQQGRYCRSCSKQVIDFSGMSDRQILHVLSQASGNTCGRFSGHQLERPLAQDIPYFLQPKKALAATLLPALLIAGTASAQEGKLTGEVNATRDAITRPHPKTKPAETASEARLIKGRVISGDGNAVTGATVAIIGGKSVTVSDAAGRFSLPFPAGKQKIVVAVRYPGYAINSILVKEKDTKTLQIKLERERRVLMGAIAMRVDDTVVKQSVAPESAPAEDITVKGSVVDAHNEPLSYADVFIKNQNRHVVADSAGNFSVVLESAQNAPVITATHAGYHDTTMQLDPAKQYPDGLRLILQSNTDLQPAIVLPDVNRTLIGIVGGLSIVRTVSVKDTLNTFVQKLYNNEMFKAFPNPAVKGQALHLRFRNAGSYAVQLFDNAGKLYLDKEYQVDEASQDPPLTIPSTVGAGIYYLKAVNAAAKKQYIEKIVVQ